MSSPRKSHDNPQIHPRISQALYDRLFLECKQRGCSVNSMVEEALRRMFEEPGAAYVDNGMVLAMLTDIRQMVQDHLQSTPAASGPSAAALPPSGPDGPLADYTARYGPMESWSSLPEAPPEREEKKKRGWWTGGA